MGTTAPASSRNLVLRRVGAVLAGLIAVVITSTATDAIMRATGVFPSVDQAMSNGLFLVATGYRTVYGVLGGYITARLAPDRPVRLAVSLGCIGAALSLAGAVLTWNRGPQFGPHWYPLALVVISVPSSWLGGKIFAR